MDWNLNDAEDRLNEVVTRAANEGPQTIHRNGTTVVVIAESTYRELTAATPSFKNWLLNGPRIDDLELLPRGQSAMRDVDL